VKPALTLRPDPNAPFEGHYFVYDGEGCVGRIHQRRGWRPETWFWWISGDLVKNGLPSYGDVSGTRDDALAAFQQAWEAAAASTDPDYRSREVIKGAGEPSPPKSENAR
jgi:hypothetical protein